MGGLRQRADDHFGENGTWIAQRNAPLAPRRDRLVKVEETSAPAERTRPGAQGRERGATLGGSRAANVVAVPCTAGLGKARHAEARMEFAGSPQNPAST